MIRYVFAVLLLVFFGSCQKDIETDCSTVVPPSDYFEISINDGAGNALIGTTYLESSFWFYSPLTTTYISPFSTPYYLRINYSDLTNGIEHYLALDGSDTDTLIFNFSQVDRPCYSEYTMSSIVYNSEETITNNLARKYQLVKII